MDTSRSKQPDFRTRLIAFLIVLAVGFVMGWLNGRSNKSASDATPSGVIAQSDDASQDSDASASDSSQDDQAYQDADATEAEAQPTTPDTNAQDDSGAETVAPTRGPTVEEDGWYTSKEEVALYIHTYGKLPGNFISKTKARNRGWVASEGNLDEVCPGMSIGGSRYYNDDGELPEKRGRQWTECDINYHGGFRGAERIVFSNDGLIFYTDDHYETFEQLY